MIFRAIFWIAVVAILMPREPDLGLGRPGAHAGAGFLSTIGQLLQPGQSSCAGHQLACVAASGAVSQLQGTAFQSLAQVKAEIEEAKRERRLAAR